MNLFVLHLLSHGCNRKGTDMCVSFGPSFLWQFLDLMLSSHIKWLLLSFIADLLSTFCMFICFRLFWEKFWLYICLFPYLSMTGHGCHCLKVPLFATILYFCIFLIFWYILIFQKEGENFLDQQFWLYLYGIVVGCGVHVISNSQRHSLWTYFFMFMFMLIFIFFYHTEFWYILEAVQNSCVD